MRLCFTPHLKSQTQVIPPRLRLWILRRRVYGALFTSFGHTFGPKHLGKIQGVAQALAVVASALGPWWLASQQEIAGSYFPAMSMMIVPFALVTVLAWLIRMPERAVVQSP